MITKDDQIIIQQLCRTVLSKNETEGIVIGRLGGLTNKNYKVDIDNNSYVIRLPGAGTEELINRKNEHICTQLANNIEVDSELLFYDDNNGIKITKYIENAITMNCKSVKSFENMKAIADTLNKLHTCNLSISVDFNVFNKIEEYEKLIYNCAEITLWDDYNIIKQNVNSLRKEMDSMNIISTICHNDPLCENFILGSDRMYLIDWEYAGMNDPMWDLADFYIEAEFAPEEEALFNKLYFGTNPDEFIKRRIVINKVLLDFLWSLWGIQRYSCGEDLLEYANSRYLRAKTNLLLLNN